MSPSARALWAVLVVALLAGCVTGTVETTVDEDGTLAEHQIEAEVDPAVYAVLENEVASDGYEGIEDRLVSDAEAVYTDVEYTESATADGVLIMLTAREGDANASEDLDVEVSEEEVLYVDRGGPGLEEEVDPEYRDAVNMTWVVHMPGEITHTNGEVRPDNESVAWTFEEHADLDEFAVASERPDDPEPTDARSYAPVAIVIAAAGSLVLALSAREYRR